MNFFYTLHFSKFFCPRNTRKTRKKEKYFFLIWIFFRFFRVFRGQYFFYFPNRFLSAAENSSVSLYFGICAELAIFIPIASAYSVS